MSASPGFSTVAPLFRSPRASRLNPSAAIVIGSTAKNGSAIPFAFVGAKRTMCRWLSDDVIVSRERAHSTMHTFSYPVKLSMK